MQNPIKLAVFNPSNVIFTQQKHFMPVHIQAFLSTFKQFGVNIYKPSIVNELTDIIDLYAGHSTHEHISLILEHATPANPIYDAIQGYNRIALTNAMFESVENNLQYYLAQPEYYTITPHFINVINKLKNYGVVYFAISTGLSCSSYRIIQDLYFNKINFTPDYIICSDNIVKPLPSVNGIYKILTALKLKPNQCMKIGGHCADIIEANRIKCVPIGITSDITLRHRMYINNAYAVLNNLNDLPDMFNPFSNTAKYITQWHYQQELTYIDV